MKTNSLYGLLIALILTLSACGGGGGGSSSQTPTASSTPAISSSSTSTAISTSSSSLVSSSSSSSVLSTSSSSSAPSSSSSVSSALSSSSSSTKKGGIVTITGLVTDNTIPNATVTIYVGSQTFITTSDADGKYTINLSVDEANINKPIKAVAKGSTIQPEVEFVSLLPSIKTLIEQAGSDATLNSIENFAVNITNVTTAEYALIDQNKFSIATDTDLEAAKKNINETEKLTLAALIKIVVDSPNHNLPSGVNTTLELVSNKTTSDAYAATLDASLIQTTIKTILNDKTLTPSSPLLGSWVMDDANLQYPNKTIAVLSFINNTDFMFVRIGKQPDSPDCSSGVEFGSYDWNQTTGDMNFEVTEDGNGDCGVARINQPQTFTVSVAGSELTLGNGVFKKIGENYPLAGSWTLVDSEGRLNVHSYISSTTAIAYSSESYSYYSYNYNATTGDFTTHTIAASNGDFEEDFTAVVTKPNDSQLSVYDPITKLTETWTELSHLEYQFPPLNNSSPKKIVTETGGNDNAALTSPNGGELWSNGEQQTIRWMTQYITGATVDLYVLHDDPADLVGNTSQTVGATINTKTWYKFASKVSNTGSYSLDPAALNGTGNAYMILVVSSSDKSKFDISNNTFTLNPSALGIFAITNGDNYPLRVKLSLDANGKLQVVNGEYDFHKLDGTMTPCDHNVQNQASCHGASDNFTITSSVFLDWAGYSTPQTLTATDSYGYTFTGTINQGVWEGTWTKVAAVNSPLTASGTFLVYPSMEIEPDLPNNQIVFSNYGSDYSFCTNCSVWNTGKHHIEQPYRRAMSFRVAQGSDINLNAIRLSAYQAPDSVDATFLVSINADANGLPGAELETFWFNMSGSTHTAPYLLTGKSVSHPKLVAGQKYWITTQVSEPTTMIVNWVMNNLDAKDLVAWSAGSAPWSDPWGTPQVQGVFRIEGEPSQ